MNDNEFGKSVFGEDWPLEEKLVKNDKFVESYIETGKFSGEKVGFFLGQGNNYYYISWYMMLEEKVILLKCLINEFNTKFPSEQDELEMRKFLPEVPAQPIGLKNKHLEKIIKEKRLPNYSGRYSAKRTR